MSYGDTFIFNYDCFIFIQVVNVLNFKRVIQFIRIQGTPGFFPDQCTGSIIILTDSIFVPPFVKFKCCQITLQTIYPPGSLAAIIFVFTFLLVTRLSPYFVFSLYPFTLLHVFHVNLVQGISFYSDDKRTWLGKTLACNEQG